MAHRPRGQIGGQCVHVINRGNARATVFRKPEGFHEFLDLMASAVPLGPMRLPTCCLTPNHFHLMVGTPSPGQAGRWTQRLMTSRVRRYHRHDGGSDHVSKWLLWKICDGT